MGIQSDSLRHRIEQHKAKNTESKNDDKWIKQAVKIVVEQLREDYKDVKEFEGYDFLIENDIPLKVIYNTIKRHGIRTYFDEQFADNVIKPDGGIVYLVDRENHKYPILISEMKKQGTNDKRLEEGLKKQAQGNAIERLGKNLIGIKAMMNHEKITPFVCFGHGCDFDVGSKILARVSTMNEFYDLNKIYIFKRDGDRDQNTYSPTSMFFRLEKWTIEDMCPILYEIADTAIKYWIY